MTVSGVYGALGARETVGETGGVQTYGKSELGKDDFLLLLVQQLRNQNPLEPLGDKEFIAQLAQFRSLESLQNITMVLGQSQAASLIGKHVKAVSNDGKEVVEGEVKSLRFYYGETLLVLEDGTEVLCGNVTEVTDGSTEGPGEDTTEGSE